MGVKVEYLTLDKMTYYHVDPNKLKKQKRLEPTFIFKLQKIPFVLKSRLKFHSAFLRVPNFRRKSKIERPQRFQRCQKSLRNVQYRFQEPWYQKSGINATLQMSALTQK